MPYITSIERMAQEEGFKAGKELGIKLGLRDGLKKAIKLKLTKQFGQQANIKSLFAAIDQEHNIDRLRQIMEAVFSAESIEDLLGRLRKPHSRTTSN